MESKVSASFEGRAWERYCIVGGAGFIGSHFTDRLLRDPRVTAVTLYDNFSSGRGWHYEHHLSDPRLRIVRGEVGDLTALTDTIAGHDVVIHLASNPDIARAANEPEIDFYQGTVLTNNVVEAMRRAAVPRLLYASGSGVYGEIGSTEAKEDFGPLGARFYLWREQAGRRGADLELLPHIRPQRAGVSFW